MCKYEMDPASIVEVTERTRFCPQTDGRRETSIPPTSLTQGYENRIKTNDAFFSTLLYNLYTIYRKQLSYSNCHCWKIEISHLIYLRPIMSFLQMKYLPLSWCFPHIYSIHQCYISQLSFMTSLNRPNYVNRIHNYQIGNGIYTPLDHLM